MGRRRTERMEEAGRPGSVGELRLAVRREEMEMASPRSVPKDDPLVFLERRLKGLVESEGAAEVAEKMLEESLKSCEDWRPVARRKKLATPEVMDERECIEGVRFFSATKLDEAEMETRLESMDSRLSEGLVAPLTRRVAARGDATGTRGISVGTTVVLEKRWKRSCRNRRYSSSFNRPSELATASSFNRWARVVVTASVGLREGVAASEEEEALVPRAREREDDGRGSAAMECRSVVGKALVDLDRDGLRAELRAGELELSLSLSSSWRVAMGVAVGGERVCATETGCMKRGAGASRSFESIRFA